MSKYNKKNKEYSISFIISFAAGVLGIILEKNILSMYEILKEHPGYILTALGVLYFMFTLYRALKDILNEYKKQTARLKRLEDVLLPKIQSETAKQFEEIQSETAKQFEEIKSETAKQFDEIKSETAAQFDKIQSEITTANRNQKSKIDSLIEQINHRFTAIGDKLDIDVRLK